MSRKKPKYETRDSNKKHCRVRPNLHNICYFNENLWPQYCDPESIVDIDFVIDSYKKSKQFATAAYVNGVNILEDINRELEGK